MSRVFAAGAPGREDEVPLSPAPGAQPFPSPVQSQPPPPDPTVTMNPAVFLSLPDLRCSLLLLVSVCRDDKPSDCVPDRLPPSARRNGAAPACLDSPPLVRRTPPGAAFTFAGSFGFLGLRSTRPAKPQSGIGGPTNRTIRLRGVIRGRSRLRLPGVRFKFCGR